MLNSETEKLLSSRGIAQYQMLRDIDGPGIGNSAIQERTERPEDGGVYIYLFGYKYPYKGSPDVYSVEQMRIVKKLLLYIVLCLKNRVVLAGVGLFFLLPKFITKPFLKALVKYYSSMICWSLWYVYLKPERYCTCVREVYRAFTVLVDREKEETNKKVLKTVRDVFCLFIEQDSAYKFRFQDIMAEVDVCKIRKGGNSTRKEILRLFSIMNERELNKEVMTSFKWKTIERLLSPAFLIKEVRSLIQDFVKEVDFNKLKPDEGDWYYNTLRLDYDFGGKTLQERIEERKKMDIENWNKYNFDELARLFIIEYNHKKGAVKDGKNN